MSSEWLTTVEVAELIGRSDRWVRDRIKDGRLPAVAGGGGKRISYKISRDAVAIMLVGQGQMKVEALAKVLGGTDEEFLQKLRELVEEALAGKAQGIKVLRKQQTPRGIVRKLEAKRLPQEFVFEAPAYDRFYHDPYHLCASAIDLKQNKAEGHFSIEITSVEYYEALCAGRAKDDYQPPWQKGQTPILYVDCLILDDPIWTPWMFRNMGAQIKEFCQAQQQTINACFAVATGEESAGLLLRYDFKEVARFKSVDGKRYPVYLNSNLRAGRLGRYLV